MLRFGQKLNIWLIVDLWVLLARRMPAVAPAGSNEALFGTNPLSLLGPVRGSNPVVYDMATASMAMGDVQIAARDGREVPLGTGLDANGQPTTDPAAIAKGCCHLVATRDRQSR